ncbi:S24 family peptidase [Aeromonas veronii]|uniref:S24 family peptidase n=2 Tax=Aeromonas TaxID=642 RepID=UPI0029D4784F|nr:S24 family peptidase [Aeromonas veronii]MDX7875374.1 S24 family peptidase [Aeromonas veronii]
MLKYKERNFFQFSETEFPKEGVLRNEWMTAKEISELPGMPGTTQGVHKKAKRDGWRYRKQEGVKGPGVEYLISVPDDGEAIDQVQDSAAVYGNQFLEEFALIPGYRVQVSAGHGSLSQGETEPYRHLAFRRKWLKWRGFEEKDLVIVWSKGDSMEPTISNNDTLVVHLGRTRPVDGHIYVVRNDDQLWVKRLQVLPSAWLLLSDNKHYQPIEVPKDEQHTFEVIGQVVHIAHDVGE